MSSHIFSPKLSRRQIFQGFAAMAASSVLSGCGSSVYRTITSTSSLSAPTPVSPPPPVSAPAPIGTPEPPAPTPPVTPGNPQPLPSGAITVASMTVAPTTVGAFGQGFVGLSYEKETLSMPLFSGSNLDLIGLFQRLGPSVLHVGGSSADKNVWTPNGSGQTSGQIAPPDVDALAAFLQATGWTCIYGVNLGGSATGATTPTLAAAEVAYVAQQLGSALVGVEIGNECEDYVDAGSYYEYNWTVEMFEALWMQYRDAIVALTPSAPLVGPAAGSNIDGWTIPFGECVTKEQINLLTQHYDRGSGTASSATVENLISPDATLASDLVALREGAQSIGIPFRIAGCNSYADGGTPDVSNAYASSLWSIDMIFNCALGGAAGVNFCGGGEKTCTPIEDIDGAVAGAQPIYYGLLLASMAGQGTLLSTQLSVGTLNVTGYAVENADGRMSLVIVNKDETQNLDLSITLPSNMTSAALQAMTQLSAAATAPSLSALSGVTIQGATVAIDGSFNPGASYSLSVSGTQLSCYVPALSAVLVQLT